MNDHVRQRVRELSEYLGVEVDETADLATIARQLACDEAYLREEPQLPDSAVMALARMSEDLSDHDREEARRFAAYLAHATD